MEKDKNKKKTNPTQEELAKDISGLPVEKKEKISPDEVFSQLNEKGKKISPDNIFRQFGEKKDGINLDGLFDRVMDSKIGELNYPNEESKEFAKRLQEFCMFIGTKSRDDKELIAWICTTITAILQPLPIEDRTKAMKAVSRMVLSGKSDEMLEYIRRVRGNKGDKYGF